MSNASLALSAAIQYQEAHIHDSRVSAIHVSAGVCLSLAYVAVILGVLSRRLGRMPLQSDDWCIIAGLDFNTAFVGAILEDTHLGLGRHAVLLKDLQAFGKSFVTEVLYNPPIVAIKVSILLLYRRIFTEKNFNSRYNKALWATGASILSYSIMQGLICIFQYTPVRMLWEPDLPGKKRINYDDVLIVVSSLNIGTDFLLLYLPIPQLWKFNKSIREKLQLIAVFLLGAFVCVVSIYRAPQVRDMSLDDPSWADSMGPVWSVMELNMGIVSACVPTYRPLFAHLFHQTLNIGNESARANSDVTLIDSKGIQRKSFGKVRTSDSSGERRVAINVSAG